ncbi:MAG: murein L,D-transpeptidase [Sphingomonadaceae bacterium]|nr:murein L,D-transpeptidase [Sphingomonadaceae bacterium]
MGKLLAVLVLLGLGIWGAVEAGLIRIGNGDGEAQSASADAPAAPAQPTVAAYFPAEDSAIPTSAGPDPRPVMQAQVILERLGFSSGVIDGEEGASLAAALRGFQVANSIQASGALDERTREALARWDHIPSTRTITISEEFARGPYVREIPDDPEDQARLSRLGYTNLMEKLAERFHTTRETLIALNSPQTRVGPGARIVVPNTGNDRIASDAAGDREWLRTLATLGVGTDQPRAASIIVDQSDGVLMAFDEDDRLIGQFPATMGSERDPLPVGEWRILGVSFNPEFHYNPELFWDVEDSENDVTLPPGPNSPVGVVWIDLSKEHYGIHGTPEPRNIGRTESHGCIRLTNWDAARLALMVRSGVRATFRA